MPIVSARFKIIVLIFAIAGIFIEVFELELSILNSGRGKEESSK